MTLSRRPFTAADDRSAERSLSMLYGGVMFNYLPLCIGVHTPDGYLSRHILRCYLVQLFRIKDRTSEFSRRIYSILHRIPVCFSP